MLGRLLRVFLGAKMYECADPWVLLQVLLACALPLQELKKQSGKTGRIGHFVPVVNMEESGKIAVDGEDLKILV